VVLRFITLAVGLKRDGHRCRPITLAFATHLGLGWIFSASWLSCLWDHRSSFVRTNKFIAHVIPGQLRWMGIELVISACLFAACATLMIADLVVGPAAAFAFAGVRLGILCVRRQARATYVLTARQLGHEPSTDVANAA
jgi:hypothetical protein